MASYHWEYTLFSDKPIWWLFDVLLFLFKTSGKCSFQIAISPAIRTDSWTSMTGNHCLFTMVHAYRQSSASLIIAISCYYMIIAWLYTWYTWYIWYYIYILYIIYIYIYMCPTSLTPLASKIMAILGCHLISHFRLWSSRMMAIFAKRSKKSDCLDTSSFTSWRYRALLSFSKWWLNGPWRL